MSKRYCEESATSTWLASFKGKVYFTLANVDGDVDLDAVNDPVLLAIGHVAEEQEREYETMYWKLL
jgi:hypothetical protein